MYPYSAYVRRITALLTGLSFLAVEFIAAMAFWLVALPGIQAEAARRSSFSVFVGKDRRLKIISPTYNLPPGDTYLTDGPVSVTLIAPVNYKLKSLTNGDQYYLDRTYTISSIPGSLSGKIFIVGNDADLMNTNLSFVQFETSDTARISVFIDSNATRPSWLNSNYTVTGRTMTTTNPAVPEMTEYRWLVAPKGTYRFGGMEAATTGAQCNYVVAIRRPANGDLGAPEQIATTQMQLPRVGHRLVMLDNGKALVVGGHDSAGAVVTGCELYDTAGQTFMQTGALIQGRINPAVVKLNDGRILAIGGDVGGIPTLTDGGGSALGIGALSTCEIFDPATGLWAATGSMGWRRRMPEAIKLADGRVFVSGGVDDTGGHAIKSTEVFDPSTSIWTAGPDMLSLGPYNTDPGLRYGHRMALLPDGRVLIAGGLWHGPELIDYGMAQCEIYDPATNTIAMANAMNAPRGRFELAPIGGGKFLAVGGLYYQAPSPPMTTAFYISTADVEMFDAATMTWTAVARLPRPMYDFAATSPDPNRVLIFDGYDVSGTEAGEVLLYDGIFNNWTQVGNLVTSRSFPYSTGTAMVADVGGKDYFLCGGAHYDETTGQTTLLYSGERFKY